MFLAAASETSVLIVDLLIILASAGVVAVAMRRLKLPTVPAYILAGFVIGPGGLAVIHDNEEVRAIGELAIALLMFGVGMHLDWSSVARRWRVLVGAGVLSVGLCSLALWGALLVIGVNAPVSLAMAMALALSSTAVVAKLLYSMREHTRAHGQLALAVLIVQDIAVFAMLLALPSLALWNGSLATLGTESSTPMLVAKEIAIGSVAMLGLVFVGRYILPRLLEEASRANSDEVMIVISTAFAIGAAALGAVSGIGSELGAFLAGLLLGRTIFKHHISAQVGTLRDLFIAVFFTTFGMYLEAEVVIFQAHIIIAATLALIVIKTMAITLGCWLAGSTPRIALASGVLLAQSGEFSLVIVMSASSAALGLIDALMLQRITAVVALSIAVTPVLSRLSSVVRQRVHGDFAPPWIKRSSSAADEHEGGAPGESPVYIVAGYGVAGRAAAQTIASRTSDIRIIDTNPVTVRSGRAEGKRFIYGDMGSAEVLEEAGIGEARLLILTAPDLTSMERACRTAKRMNPDVRIIARAAFEGHCERLHAAGANEVIVEEITLAVALERAVANAINERVEGGGDEAGAVRSSA